MQNQKTLETYQIPNSILLIYKLKKIENSIVELNKNCLSNSSVFKCSIEKIENDIKNLKNYL